MNRGSVLVPTCLLLLLLATAGCHTTQVTPPPKDPSAPPFTQLAEEQPQGVPPAEGPDRRTPCDVPLATSPEALLTPSGVASLQAALRREGLLEGRPTGDDLGARTLEALRRFQRREGLPATGLPDYASLQALGIPPDEAFRKRARTACRAPGGDG